MSDRPEDYTDPEPTEPTEPAGQGTAERPDAPWWHRPHGVDPTWGPQGGWPQGGWPQGGWPQGGGPQGGWPRGGGEQGEGPQDPYAQSPQAPTGWQSDQWAAGQWGWGPSVGGWGSPAYPPAPVTGIRPHRKGLAALAATVLTALALLIGVGIGYGVWSPGTTPTSGRSLGPVGGTASSPFTRAAATSSSTGGTKVSSATGAPSNIATIRAKVRPELVDINTVLRYETAEAAGTGMVLTPTGKVLTNNHVIEGATKISVTDLGNGKTYSARVLGYTRTNDIAVLQLEGASGLKTVDIGNSSSVKVGEAIVGIGNAGGTGGVPSAAGGSVTALNQSITASDQGSLGTTYEHLTGLIESNADIQPGDSGGPLVTTSGAVVGMDTAASAAQGYSFQGAATGRGYSIPINEAISTAHQIIAGKTSSSVHIGGTAFLGVYVGPTTQRTRSSRFGFGSTSVFTSRTSTLTPGTPPATSGALVEQVIPNTPAQAAGLAATDVITSVDGTPIRSPGDLTNVLLRYHPGDSVKVGWTTRSGGTATTTVRLAAGPPE
jgi:S1-C subfamily serine protease